MDGSGKGMTFEDLTSVYRTERGSPTLTRVRHDLYPAMRALSSEQSKKCERLAAEDPESIIFDGALERRRKTLHYVKLVTELRMRKIAGSCMTGAMGAKHPLDLLTPEELEFYESVLASAKRLVSIGYEKPKATIPDISKPMPPKGESPATPRAPAVPDAYVPDSLEDMLDFDDEEGSPPALEEDEHIFGKRVTVKILEDLPRFSGPDRDYELSKEDVVRMPAVMAEALVNRGKARIVDVRP